MNTDLYEVSLSGDHPGYQSVSLRCRPGYDNHVVVMVDVQKLIHYSDQHEHQSFVVSPVEEWDQDKRQGIFEFLAPPSPKERHVEMPIVSFNEVKEESEQPILKILGRRSERVSRWVGYTNGRHRTRYLHFAGAQEMPVMCHKDQVALLEQYCGV
ncbi:hypothetical protein IFT47_26100 [Pseudomonas sp. CFBP 13711]|jgi:hypothetical protein|uniref:plasmid fertility inhibition factor family protein n=1 Tax=unclassified Pseudomonas TaxID=196821 RepID=UPI00177B00B0|nr:MULTISPECIES: hypothetical protein [unclassified Pseudomonas]MBD8710112.1 hypothetical protein [Pseudomonas sp. CFBP 13711]MBD8715400.1 hypothetical protein [Pseudomonas sp. CFBP 13715]